MIRCCTDGDVELIEKGKALLQEIADAYISKRTESIDTDEELPEIRFYYEGVEVRFAATVLLLLYASVMPASYCNIYYHSMVCLSVTAMCHAHADGWNEILAVVLCNFFLSFKRYRCTVVKSYSVSFFW